MPAHSYSASWLPADRCSTLLLLRQRLTQPCQHLLQLTLQHMHPPTKLSSLCPGSRQLLFVLLQLLHRGADDSWLCCSSSFDAV